MKRALRALTLAALVALTAAVGGCSKSQKPPEENPLTADLVDYRNAVSMLREGRVDEAIQLLLRARQSYPYDANVPNALGLAFLYRRDYTNAFKSFSEALKLNPNLAEARLNRGVALMEEGKLDESEKDFQKILDGPPSLEKVHAHFNLGLLLAKRQAWLEAEKELSLVLMDDPLYRRAYKERGLVRMKVENHHGALEDFLKFLKDEPNDADSNYNAALCLLTTGRRDLAVKYMTRAAAAAPETDVGKKARRFLEAEPRAPGEEP